MAAPVFVVNRYFCAAGLGDISAAWRRASIMLAAGIVTVPLVIMVLIFQRRTVEGITAGASK